VKPTKPAQMPHVCRKCGETFPDHWTCNRHWTRTHKFPSVGYCNSNCGTKMTYHELRAGRALYGEGARR
jgi:hypothetical protein